MRVVQHRMRNVTAALWLALALIGLGLGACDPDGLLTPSATPTVTVFILPATATIDPVIPTVGAPNIGGDSTFGTRIAAFTPAAPDVIGPSRLTVTPAPGATQASIPLQFVMPDGVMLAGQFFAAPQRPAPALLLAHTGGQDRTAWAALIPGLQARGINVLAVDLRGHGASGGSPDPALTANDLTTVAARLENLPGVDGARLFFGAMGDSTGAVLSVCAAYPANRCRGMVVISPVDPGSDTLSAYRGRPLLVVYGLDDGGSSAAAASIRQVSGSAARLLAYPGSARDGALIDAQADLPGALASWILTGN